MMPKWHILGGFLFSLCLFFIFDIGWIAALIIFVSSILIDIDHYILYVIKKKRMHPTEFWKWSKNQISKWRKFSKEEKELHKSPQFLLHGLEGLIILFILSFFWNFFYWIFLGFGFHLCLDLIEKIRLGGHPSTKISQVWLWHRNKKKKKVLK